MAATRDWFNKKKDWIKRRFQTCSHLIGVDIGLSAIKILELSLNNGRYQVENFSFQPLPAGVVNEKEIKDPAALTQYLRKAFSACRFGSKNLAMAIPDSYVFTKIIQLNPTLKNDDLEMQILLETEQHFPYPLEEMHLDFQRFGMEDVLVVASHKKNIDKRVAALSVNGFAVKVVDVESYVLERVVPLLSNHFIEVDKPVAIININSNVFILTIISDGQAKYIQREIFDETFSLQNQKELLLLHIQRSLDAFYSTHSHEKIELIILTGDVMPASEIDKWFAEGLGIKTIIGNPFMDMTLTKGTEDLITYASQFVLCCGLALRSWN